MTIYFYNDKTNEFTQKGEAHPNQRRPGEFLIPHGATTQKPPHPKKSFAIVFKDDKWQYTKDFRNKVAINKKTLIQTKINKIGKIDDDLIIDFKPNKYNLYKLVNDKIIDDDIKIKEIEDKIRTNIINRFLDKKAQDMKYKNFQSVLAWAGVESKYQKECIKLANFGSLVWETVEKNNNFTNEKLIKEIEKLWL